MKREITIHICDRCDAEMPMTNGGYYVVPDGEEDEGDEGE